MQSILRLEALYGPRLTGGFTLNAKYSAIGRPIWAQFNWRIYIKCKEFCGFSFAYNVIEDFRTWHFSSVLVSPFSFRGSPNFYD